MSEPRPQVDEGEARTPITGKVAALLNERELVINVGSVAGVQRGMKLRVLAAEPVEVRDPDTDEVLGEISREKVRVQAAEVDAQMTICRTYETLRGGALALPAGLSAEPASVRTLRTNDRGYIPPISERESYVSIGDVVEEIL